MTQSLYEIEQEFAELMVLLEDPEATSDDLAAAMDTLDGTKLAFNTKIENYARVIAHLDAQAETLKAAEKRIAARRTSLANNAICLRLRMLASMQKTSVKKVKGELFTVAVSKGKAFVEVQADFDVTRDIAPAYTKQADPTLDKAKVLADLQAGVKFSGLRIGKPGEHLTIR